MNRNLRVLFVNRMACIERGGGETFDLEISRHLARIGAQVSFLSGAPLFSPPPLPVDGASVLHTPWLKLFPWDKIKGGWRLRVLEFEWFELRAARWLRRHADQFDVVQVCELPNFVLWSKNLGVDLPFVLRLTAPNFHDPRGGVRRADALDSLADNPSLRVELSAAGRARVLERHAWSSSAAKLMDLYRRLVDARPRA